MNHLSKKSEEIPGMDLTRKYSTEAAPISPQNDDKVKKDLEKTKKDLGKLKDWIVKKYSFTKAIGVLPPQSLDLFIDEEEIPKETDKHVHLYMIVPEDNFKEIPKIKEALVKQIDSLNFKEKIWVQIKTPVDIWEACHDSKFDLAYAIAMSMPLFDTGFLGALRFSQIHRSILH